ncbi:hypothetical protein COLO4_29872 [Corchorus olitorius]|uniref:Uncharacterized protein n=1 Tax=Corchorus olitorius TaxID=93759 RepID=A0A1R3HCR8_9ROSI|nr:hypothetical protein COLO4_29872 [Corchorus olitorius]
MRDSQHSTAPPLLLAEETHVSEANSRLESEMVVVGGVTSLNGSQQKEEPLPPWRF